VRVEVSVFRADDLDEVRELLPGQSILIGRVETADLRLLDVQASRRHARLSLEGDGLWVEDLGSSAGTTLAGAPLEGRALAVLPSKVEIGRYRLELRDADQAPAGPAVWEVFQKEELLGEGGFGKVFAARRRSDGWEVAIKEIALQGDNEQLERFTREARLCENLEHPNLVRIHAVRLEGDVAFQVMERVRGKDLEQILRLGPLPIVQAFAVAESLASGLLAMHELGVIHRDIKPANVMLCEDGQVKITDFGLARSLAAGQTLTQTLMGMGTLTYVAPEQAADAKRARPPADLYSMGATLYHALAWRPPFDAGSLEELLAAIDAQEPVPLLDLRPDCPPALARVVERLLAKDPDDRYPNAKILLRRLGAAREG
jgi:serine/threonine protein kinase